MKNYFAKNLILIFFPALLFPYLLQAQEIVVNEYYNTASQNDEWTELVVVKDDLNLVGWYLGDNNAATTSWQPKIKFKNHPLWQHLRAGTIITIDHASNSANCDDAEDTDKSDGYIRVCCRNSTYFEGGSTTTLFLADDGDFVQLVDPTGKMVHAIGHDNNPGNSVEGGNCFSTSTRWTNTTAAEPATRPCGNFLFYRFGMNAPTALKAICGNNADFFAGMQSNSSNPFIDTSDTPFTGIGNGFFNNNWIIKLRAPVILAQTICPQTTPQGGITLSWQAATDPFPGDGTIGYMVLKNQNGQFDIPEQGIQYTVGQTIGSGNNQSSVAAILIGSANTSFTDNGPGAQNSRYRIFPFRYVNTPNFQHPTRGRTYNLEQYVKVNDAQAPVVTVVNDTLCSPGFATLRIIPVALPGPGGVNWYDAQIGGNLLSSGPDSLRIQVNQTRSFWAEIVSAGLCSDTRYEVKAVVSPVEFTILKTDSICEGTPANFLGQPANVQFNWSLLRAPAGVVTSRSDSAGWRMNIPYYPEKKWIVFRVKARNSIGCEKIVTDSLFTVPFLPRFEAEPSDPVSGTLVTFKPKSDKTNLGVSNWAIDPGPVLSSDSSFARATASGDSLRVSGEIYTLLPQGGIFCKVKTETKFKVENPLPPASLKPINNLVTANGDDKNATLDFDSREVIHLEIFNRWGEKVYSADKYSNDWKPDRKVPGCYFYTADIKEKTDIGFKKIRGWVMVTD
jgi:hypothetical protein